MTGSSRPSAVFDCMVFLQGAARKESPAGLCLALAQAGAIELLVSDSIIAEVRNVLTRPVLQNKFSVLTAAFVDEWRSLCARFRRTYPMWPTHSATSGIQRTSLT